MLFALGAVHVNGADLEKHDLLIVEGSALIAAGAAAIAVRLADVD
jgi:hypothetical protein